MRFWKWQKVVHFSGIVVNKKKDIYLFIYNIRVYVITNVKSRVDKFLSTFVHCSTLEL